MKVLNIPWLYDILSIIIANTYNSMIHLYSIMFDSSKKKLLKNYFNIMGGSDGGMGKKVVEMERRIPILKKSYHGK